MAINKKLIHFNKMEDFKERLGNSEILDTSIVFIKDTSTIYTHGQEYQWVKWSYLEADLPLGCTYFITSDNEIFTDANGDIILVKE